jgi:PAS domain S-box-containing protein
VAKTDDLREVLGDLWPRVLEHVSEAVLVLDDQRILRFANDRARRMLGYEEDHPVGSRCRLTTRGVDCEHACPLTYALESKMEQVEDFATIYHTRDGEAVPLKVTVIPVLAEDGAFRGAVEILRRADPDPGFVLAGRSEAAASLRRRVLEVAATGGHVALVGEGPACTDVARAIHRFARLAEPLFHTWDGSWDDVPAWPPGTMYADVPDGVELLRSSPPEGWRVIAGVPDPELGSGDGRLRHELIQLPRAAEAGDDLPLMVAAWVRSLRPELTVHPQALERLSCVAAEHGFERLQRMLHAAVAAAGDMLEEQHLPEVDHRAVLFDELLSHGNPLAALEQRLIQEVLDRSGWRMQEAAELLGISRVTLWRKLKDYGIERPNNG